MADDVRIAIFSDVHGNLEALDAMIEDAEQEQATEWICLGDIVGYGADPERCIERVRARCTTVLRGNHDDEAAGNRSLSDYNPVARAALEFVRETLCADSKRYLHGLPYTGATDHYAAVHASLADPPLFDYVCDAQSALEHFGVQSQAIAFCGHTHVPCVWELTRRTLRLSPPADFTLRRDRRCLVNVGSVGQPRDGDPKACYVLFTPGASRIEFRRVEYDMDTAQRKIRKAGLPGFLALRLAVGR